MIDVAPGEMFATRCVIKLVAEIAVFGVEQKMDAYRKSRKRIHGSIERCEPRRKYVWLLVHENESSQHRGSRSGFNPASLLRRRTEQSSRLDTVQLGPALQQIRIALLLQLILV